MFEIIAIDEWLVKGTSEGYNYISGPFDLNYKFPWKLFRAPLFVVPKPGVHKYRPSVHLSWNEHFTLSSINDLLCEY